MKTMALSQFEATCQASVEKVCQTGQPVLLTKAGKTIAQILPPPPKTAQQSRFGCMRDTVEFIGDIVSPLPSQDWDALR